MQSSVHQSENLLFFVLLQLIVIVLVARMGGNLARRLGQPRAVGEIVAGLVLGPSLLGHMLPEFSNYLFHSVPSAPMGVLSQIGLVLLMFQIGMDFDFSHLGSKRNKMAVTNVSIASVGLPLILGIGLGWFSAPYLAPGIHVLPYSLFVGTALSITAVPILGRIMMEFDLTRTPVGAIAISAAAMNDVAGWMLLAAISALAVAQFSIQSVLSQIGWLLLYVGVCWWVVRPFALWLIRKADLSGTRLPPNLLASMLALIFASAICTSLIGIFAIFGGFMLGVLVHDQQKFVALWKKTVGDFVIVFFLPIFFTYTGLRTNIAGLDTAELWQWCLLFIAVAVIGKFGGAFVAARASGLNRHEAGTIAILMNTRALMELIVLNIGYDLGCIPHDVFTMLVIMAVFTTVITSPVLRSHLPRFGHIIPKGVDA